jgi:hypothetical protein
MGDQESDIEAPARSEDLVAPGAGDPESNMEAPARSCRDPPSTSESHPFTIAVLVGVANDDGFCARAARYLSWDGCQPQEDRIYARLLDAMPTPMRSDCRRRRSPLLRVSGET